MSFVMRMRMAVEVEFTWSKIMAFLAFYKCQRIKRITSTRMASGREVATPMSHGRRTTSHCTKMPSRAQRSCALRHSEKMCSSVSRTPGQWAHHDSSKVLMFLWWRWARVLSRPRCRSHEKKFDFSGELGCPNPHRVVCRSFPLYGTVSSTRGKRLVAWQGEQMLVVVAPESEMFKAVQEHT